MHLQDLWPVLERAPFAAAVRQNALLFPWIESVHVLAIVLVVGTISIVDLRLLGVASRSKAVSRLAGEVLPFTWGAYAVAATTGFLLFSSDATGYAADIQFRLKMLTMAVAGANMLAFHFFPYRTVGQWDVAPIPPMAARVSAGLSLTCWAAIVVFGRWVGFSLN